jgi:dehydration protein DpgD
MDAEQSNFVQYEKQNNIAFITLNRAEKLNAVNRAMVEEIGKIWVDFRDDDNLYVAIFSGAGSSFCAGADIKDLGEVERGNYNLSHSVTLGDKPASPSAYSVFKPIIGALKGNVMGSGFWLALECDIRIASEDTVFALPEPRVGIPTAFAGLLNRYVPHAIANEFLLTGSRIGVQRAYEVGLVNKVVSSDRLMAEATETANQICRNAPLAVGAMKKLIRRCWDMDFGSAMAYTDSVIVPVHSSDDAAEGRRAFLEKRLPVWKDR